METKEIEIKKSYLEVWWFCILSVILIPVFFVINGLIDSFAFLEGITETFIPILEGVIIFVCYLMAIYTYLAIKTRHYSYDSIGMSMIEGILTKASITVPLYKIESLTASANILGNGTITFHTVAIKDDTSCLRTIEYIRGVTAVRAELAHAIEMSKKAHGIKSVDTF